MKLKIFVFLICLSGIYNVNATVHIITAEGTTIPTDIFLPAVTYAGIGDTIQWVWLSGIHTTESISIPSGAAQWASDIDASTTSFSYVVTVVGTYIYDCHASFSHGMDGIIEVAAVAGMPTLLNRRLSKAYPNPFTDKITVEFTNAESICVYNLMGQRTETIAVNKGQTEAVIDLSGNSKGIYFYSIVTTGGIIETRKIVKL